MATDPRATNGSPVFTGFALLTSRIPQESICRSSTPISTSTPPRLHFFSLRYSSNHSRLRVMQSKSNRGSSIPCGVRG